MNSDQLISVTEARALAAQVQALPDSGSVILAGSHRRGLHSTHDVDLVVVGSGMEFTHALTTIGVEWGGGTKKRWVKLSSGIYLDLVLTTREHEGSALLYYTGSKEFNIRTRSRAKGLGLKLNEYGLWGYIGGRDQQVCDNTERAILTCINLEGYLDPATRR